MANEKSRLYGVQFHPEVDLTPNGKLMMKNFLLDVAGLSGNFTMQSRELECIDYIKKEIGTSKVLVRAVTLSCRISHFLPHSALNNDTFRSAHHHL